MTSSPLGPVHETGAGLIGAMNASASARWTNLTPAPQPPGLTGSAVVYDAADGYVLAFGGLLGANATNQTWTFHDGVWTNSTAVVGPAPSPRYDMGMAYDPNTSEVLAFGGLTAPHQTARGPSCFPPTGFAGCPLNDTWTYAHGVWTALHPSCARTNGTTVTGLSCVTLVGGPAPMVFDGRDHYVLMTQYFDAPYSAYGSPAPLDPTWIFLNSTWTQVLSPAIADANFTMSRAEIGALAYDAADGVVVGFGSGTNGFVPGPGEDAWDPNATNATYLYANYSWTPLAANASAPPPRFDPGLAYDARDGYVLLYGGWNHTCLAWGNGTCRGYAIDPLNDSWAFHNDTWSQLPVGGAPSPLGDPRLVDDPGDRTLLQVGGWTCPSTGCGDTSPGGGWFCQTENSSLDPVIEPCPTAATNAPAMWAWGATPPLESVSISASRLSVTAGIAVNFTVGYRAGSPPISFAWAFSDGTNATAQNVSHRWTTGGLYPVGVWVNDSAGHTAFAGTNLTVHAPLGAVPAALPGPADVGLPVQFTPGSINGTPPYAYRWVFGDGNTSALAAPSHVYAANGSFSVNLTVVDSGGATSNASLVEVVHSALTVTLNITPIPADLGELVNFSANVSGGTAPYAFAWAFGDGGLGGDLANISHIYTTNGPFDPAVDVTDAAGASVTVSRSVAIALNVSILSNGTLGAAPLGLGFTCRVTGGHPGYAYAWSFGDGASSALPDPSHVYDTPGTFAATVRVTDAAGATAESAAWTVVVAAGGGPLTLQLRADPTSVAVGTVETITASPQGGAGAYTLLWTNLAPGCTAGSVLTIRCAASVSGTYQVAAAVTDARGGEATAGATFTVSPTGAPTGLTGPSPPAGLGAFAVEEIAAGALAGVVAAAAAGYGLGLVARRRPSARSFADPYDRYRRPEPPPPDAPPAAKLPDARDPLHNLL